MRPHVIVILLSLALHCQSQQSLTGDWNDEQKAIKRPFGPGLGWYGKRVVNDEDDDDPHVFDDFAKRIMLRYAIYHGPHGERDVVFPGDNELDFDDTVDAQYGDHTEDADEQPVDDTEDADEKLIKRAFGSLFSSNSRFDRDLQDSNEINDFYNYKISDSKRAQGDFGLGSYGRLNFGRMGLGRYGKRGYGKVGLGKYGKRGYGSLDLGKYGKRGGLLDLGKYGKRYGHLDLGKYGKRVGYLGLGDYGKRDGLLGLGKYGKRGYGLLGLGKYGKRGYGYLGLGKYGKRGIPFNSLGRYGKRYDFSLLGLGRYGKRDLVETANMREVDEKRGIPLRGLGKYGKRVTNDDSDLSDNPNEISTEDDLTYL